MATSFDWWQLTRSGSDTPNPNTYTQRSEAFASAAGRNGGAMLVTTRNRAGMSHWVGVVRGAGAMQAATHLAQAVAAEAVESKVGPDMAAHAVGHLEADPSAEAIRENQHNVDPAEVVRRMAVAVPVGGWVAAVARKPTNAETKRAQRWYQHRIGTKLPTHHAFTGSTLVTSIWVGGPDRGDVKSLLSQIGSFLPGFDVAAKPALPSLAVPTAAFALPGLAAFGAGHYFGLDPTTVAAAASGLGGVALAVASGWSPSKWRTAARGVARARLPMPGKRLFPPKRPKREVEEFRDQKREPGHPGGYPLASNSFLVGPTVVAGMVAPHAGAASGVSKTRARAVPAALREPIGPPVGMADGQQVHIDATEIHQGVGLVGVPGAGKSAALAGIYGWHCLQRADPAPDRPDWTTDNALVVFESKGEGAQSYAHWAEVAGDKTAIMEVADPDTWAVDVFGTGPASERARYFLNAMTYAFDKGEIMGRSSETLQATLTAAFSATEAVRRRAGVDPDSSPVHLAWVLCGGKGDEAAVNLAAAIESEGDADAASALANLFGGKVTPAQRRNLSEAPRNKLGDLSPAETYFSSARRKVTWKQVLNNHRSVVINTGATRAGHTVDAKLTQRMSALILFSLRDAIQRNCSGWRGQGRAVTIFADELSLVASQSPEVVTWLRQQGRAYGVRTVFATQQPEQLPHEVRRAFMSFGTFFWLRQSVPEIAHAASEDLSLLGEDYNPADVAGLDMYTAVLRATADGRPQTPVPVDLTWWDGDKPDAVRQWREDRVRPMGVAT